MQIKISYFITCWNYQTRSKKRKNWGYGLSYINKFEHVSTCFNKIQYVQSYFELKWWVIIGESLVTHIYYKSHNHSNMYRWTRLFINSHSCEYKWIFILCDSLIQVNKDSAISFMNKSPFSSSLCHLDDVQALMFDSWTHFNWLQHFSNWTVRIRLFIYFYYQKAFGVAIFIIHSSLWFQVWIRAVLLFWKVSNSAMLLFDRLIGCHLINASSTCAWNWFRI